jgi:sugar/nucleoside kinase (ribokinase family)
VGIGMLGGKTRFVGKCGQGVMAKLLIAGLEKSRVEPALLSSNTPTGRVLSIITPDAQRSMFTFLGAAAETQPEEMRTGFFEDAAVVHVEGYMLYNEALILGVMERAKAAGAAISLDLASFNVVEESHGLLKRIVDDYVDIVLANEDEARAFTGIDDEAEALEVMARAADIAVLKIGARGSYICHGDTTIHTPANGGGDIVDTTGAGDLWASGFLYGLISGMDLTDSGRLASRCGFEVCQTVGAAIPASGWERIHQCVNDLRADASQSSREG